MIDEKETAELLLLIIKHFFIMMEVKKSSDFFFIPINRAHHLEFYSLDENTHCVLPHKKGSLKLLQPKSRRILKMNHF